MEESTRACANCGVSLEGAHWKRRFCSRRCASAAWYRSRPDPVTDGEKMCKLCLMVKPAAQFATNRLCKDGLRPECKACIAAIGKATWKDTSHRPSRAYEYKRNERLKRKFGITQADYEAMWAEQGGVCAICHEARSWNRREELLAIDHSHMSGQVRGLLCHACNQALGLMQDDTKRMLLAIEYLERHRQQEDQ